MDVCLIWKLLGAWICCAALFLVSAHGQELPAVKAPEVYRMNGRFLAEAKAMLQRDNAAMRHAFDHLVERADAALAAGPFSVTEKTVTPPSGNKHDYMSMGSYWWPDPNKEDGLPYIRRDGKVNPETREDASDSPRMGRMASAVDVLALAFYFTGEEKYAAHAALLLRTWFLDPPTRMNPHLEYGQAIPGRVTGRDIGIIDTVRLLRVPDAAILLRDSAAWTDADHKALRQWFGAYLEWLTTSRHGRREAGKRNNHGTWYDAQVAGFALFVGDRKTARKVLEAAGPKRLTAHISPDGRQRHELARTRSFDYSCYNLDAMFHCARFAEHLDIDVWGFQIGERPALRAALAYLAPHADPEKEWPHRQITKLNPLRLLSLLRQGYLVYGEETFLDMVQSLPEEKRQRHISQLLYPTSLAGSTPPGVAP